MAIQVWDVTAGQKLETAGLTVHTGTARLGPASGARVVMHGSAPQPFGFFVPDAPALGPGEPEPLLLAEAWLMLATSPSSHGMDPMGIETVTATYADDPRGGGARWLQVSGFAFADQPIRIGYRVTFPHAGGA